MSGKKKKLLGWALAAVAIALLLGIRLWPLAVAILWSVVIAYLLFPMQRRFCRKFSPGVSAILSFAVSFGLVTLLVGLLTPALINQFKGLMAQMPRILGNVSNGLDQASGWIQRQVDLESLGVQGLGLSDWRERVSVMIQQVQVPPEDAGGGGGLSLGLVLLIPFLSFYLLKDREAFSTQMLYLVPVMWRERVQVMCDHIHHRLQSYIRGQVLSSLIVGLLTAAGLFAVHVPYALLLGAITAVCNLVPFFGPLVSTIIIAVVALMDGWRPFLFGLIVALGMQQVENLIVAPKIVGERLDMHPALITLSVMAGSLLMGVPGMLLAIPIVIILQAITQFVVEWATTRHKLEPED